jgi:hypothetical protein
MIPTQRLSQEGWQRPALSRYNVLIFVLQILKGLLSCGTFALPIPSAWNSFFFLFL